MKNIITAIFILMIGSTSRAQFIRCSGTLPFWYLDHKRKDIWQLWSPDKKHFSSHSRLMGDEIRFGGNWTSVEATARVFVSIKFTEKDPKSKKYTFSTDDRSWFIVTKGKLSLNCDISETEFF